MAKEDFCFTYYDGDAARDKAHMTRLERGAYDDIISAQRKFGHLTLDQIKKVLSRDFDECWVSLEMIMKKDDEGKYYIEWVRKSVEKMIAHSKKQSDNSKKRWGKESHGNAMGIPRESQTDAKSIPLEDGDGNGESILKEEVVGEENFLLPSMATEFKNLNPKYPLDKLVDFPALQEIVSKVSKMDSLKGGPQKNFEHILKRWGEIVVHVRADSHFSKYSISQINKHFQSVIQSINADGSTTHFKSSSGGAEKLGTSAARVKRLKEW